MKGDEGLWVDANDGQTGAVTVQELGEEANEHGADLLVGGV